MKDEKKNSDKTLNQEIKELEERTNWFYSDEFELEEAVQKYKEARERIAERFERFTKRNRSFKRRF